MAEHASNQSEYTQPQFFTAHVARTLDGDIHRITTNNTQAHRLAAEGHVLDINTPVARLLEEGLLDRNVEDVMGDPTWLRIAPELRGYQSLSTEEPMYAVNPPDLPPAIARKRLEVVKHLMGDEDVQAYLELSEIIMANNHQRPCDESLLSPASKGASFQRIYNNDIAAIENWYREAQGDLDSIEDDSAAGVIDSILLKQQIDELSFVLDELEAMQPSVSLSAG